MQVYRSTDDLPHFHHAVLTIGTFDGVHTGHQQVIAQLRKEAAQINGETVIITFDPHPRMVVNAGSNLRLLNIAAEKTELLAASGVDNLAIVPFTEKFAHLSAEEYIRDFLVRHFHPHTIIIGYDHHFGKGRTGNYQLLNAAASTNHYRLKEIPAHVLDSISVSSTRIREAIAIGDMQTANVLLGYTFFFSGTVVEGDRLGRTLGFPTANLQIEDPHKILPGDGVYAVDAVVDDQPEQRLKGMMNIGYRPTVGGRKKLIEVNLFEFDRPIYHRTLKVFVKQFLRSEVKFDGLDALKKQLAIDKLNAEKW
ncbi:MAG TPA: bifunctional riboflavin kinase/FAD synthetase [Puia sp.]|nr:bifunctional riboflavin kinase/FAD synthetase [Puia sp.]